MFLTPSRTLITVYQWDHRNRLVAVGDYLNYEDYCTGIAAFEQLVAYTYDPFNQLSWSAGR